MIKDDEIKITDQEYRSFLDIIKKVANYDFTEYSEKSLKRRISRILDVKNIKFSEFAELLKKNTKFLEQAINDITVNTTELFRDPKVWITIRDTVLPLFKHKKTINIWHIGCSTGQEVYSMLIILYELGYLHKSRIYGTDLNSEALATARKGIYSYKFNAEYLKNFDQVFNKNKTTQDTITPYSKYFYIDKNKDILKVRRFFINRALFIKHNIITLENIFNIKFDIIVCRNVIIYFNPTLQDKMFNFFYNNLLNYGYLILGSHETIISPKLYGFKKVGEFFYKDPGISIYSH